MTTLDIPRRLLKPRLTTPETREYLALIHGVAVSVSTLCKWRCIGKGPKSERIGGSVYYQASAVDAWVFTPNEARG